MSDTPTTPADGQIIKPGATTFYELQIRDDERGDVFADPAAFAHWQRVAMTFARSSLVPKHLRGEAHLPDILIALDMARKLKLNPLQVIQSLYVVNETAGWYTTFLTALAQNDGWDLDYEVREIGEPITYVRPTKNGSEKCTIPNLGVRCLMSRRLVASSIPPKRGIEVTTEQAIKARWANNEQYVHSTEHMLTNRAATFAVRRHAPTLLLGLHTQDELEDMRDDPEATYEEPEKKPARGVAAVRAAVSPPPSPAVADHPTGQTAQGGGLSTAAETAYQRGLGALDAEDAKAKNRPTGAKPEPCGALHPRTRIRCTTEFYKNPNTGQWMGHTNHGYEPPELGFRVWWNDDGTQGPISREEWLAQNPERLAERDAAIAGGAVEREEAAAKAAEGADDTKVPKRNSVLEADMINAALITQPRGSKVLFEVAKRAHREKLGASKLGDERTVEALRFGVTRGYWELLGDEKKPDVWLRAPGAKPQADDAQTGPQGEPTGHQSPPDTGASVGEQESAEVKAALGSDVEVWSPADLVPLIGDEELALSEDSRFAAGADQIIAALAIRAGLPVDKQGVHVDGAPAGALRRFLAGLRMTRNR